MRELRLSNTNLVAIVDEEDFERLNVYEWDLRFTRGEPSRITRNRSHLPAVALASEVMNQHSVMFDHKDRSIFNNRKSNLREATFSQNAANRGKQRGKYSSLFKGVNYHKRDELWHSRIMFQGKPIHLGCFENEIDAALAYNKKALELFGEFAVLNVV